MAPKIHFSVLMALIAICLSLTSVKVINAHTDGTATYYTPPYVPSACYGYEDQGVIIAAASDAIWNNGGACGQYYEVNCVSGTNAGTPNPCRGSGSVTVKIVDYCPSGCRGTIDLSQEAFSTIADPNSGVINITYKQA